MSLPMNTQMAQQVVIKNSVDIKHEYTYESKAHCRFCAELKSSDELLDLTLHGETYLEFIKILQFLKVDFVDLSWTDELPKTTCEPCSTAFNDAFFFFKKVQQSQAFLKAYYGVPIMKPAENETKEAIVEANVNPSQSQPKDAYSFQADVEDGMSSLQENYSVPIVEMRCDDSASSSDSEPKKRTYKARPKKKRKQSTVYRKPRVRKPAEKKARVMKGSWNLYKWICIHCNVKCDTMYELRTHSKDSHNICYGFKCVDCEDDFNTFNSFIEHVRRHRLNLRFVNYIEIFKCFDNENTKSATTTIKVFIY
jgi:hypothetical protein